MSKILFEKLYIVYLRIVYVSIAIKIEVAIALKATGISDPPFVIKGALEMASKSYLTSPHNCL